MTPERAASIFRELLETPIHELANLPRRTGLTGHPAVQDLEHARELLTALWVALQSGPGPNWERVTTAWTAMRQRHGELRHGAQGPAQPAWIRPDAPVKPGLGDPAPGTAQEQQATQDRQRFVPAGKPAYVAPPAAAVPPPVAPPPGYPPPEWGPPGQALANYPPPEWGPQPPQGVTYPQPAPEARRAPPPAPKRTSQALEEPQDAGDIRNSVAKYAAFCAACSGQPDRVFATMIEYGIQSPEAREQLDQSWQDRFDDDAALQEQWERLYHQFRQRLGAR